MGWENLIRFAFGDDHPVTLRMPGVVGVDTEKLVGKAVIDSSTVTTSASLTYCCSQTKLEKTVIWTGMLMVDRQGKKGFKRDFGVKIGQQSLID